MAKKRFLTLLSTGLLMLGISTAAPSQALPVELSSSSSSSSSSVLQDLLSSVAPEEEAPGNAPKNFPGYPEITPDSTIPLQVLMPDGGEREVIISLPENYDPTRSYPVWLAFAGRNISPEHMSTDTGLQNASDAIVAYGRGIGNAWAGAPYATTTMAEDIAYSRAVVDRIAENYSVDRERVYSIGHSNGGGFSLALACFAPDLVAGVASVSGIFYEPGTPVSGQCAAQPVPTVIIHARWDGLSHFNGNIAHGKPYVGANQMAATQAEINGCGPEPLRTEIAEGLSRTQWQGCAAETELIVSDNNVHGWPNYSAFEAWDFLARQ
ncbi:alpha/beta hydrolase family esterase [Corynebacterium occultum]|uniref:alpha/beta hydrolase family esterase n=1 Tax=Corynebacterium occultum TaxID=2675219 RepID=UPI0018CECEFD|nr:alpha/beta hydrolase-fold protein [Corynebacterium occultum]